MGEQKKKKGKEEKRKKLARPHHDVGLPLLLLAAARAAPEIDSRTEERLPSHESPQRASKRTTLQVPMYERRNTECGLRSTAVKLPSPLPPPSRCCGPGVVVWSLTQDGPSSFLPVQVRMRDGSSVLSGPRGSQVAPGGRHDRASNEGITAGLSPCNPLTPLWPGDRWPVPSWTDARAR